MSDFPETTSVNGDVHHTIDAPTLIFHDSAHSIVFRDQLRRQSSYSYSRSISSDMAHSFHSPSNRMRSLSTGSSHSGRPYDDGENTPSETGSVSSGNGPISESKSIPFHPNSHDARPTFIIANITPVLEPLEALPLTSLDEFQPLLSSTPFVQESAEEWNEDLSQKEKDVVTLLFNEKCVVKTIKNQEWTEFLHRFKDSDVASMSQKVSFKTSTTLLPPGGIKMRCYGSSREYSHGVIFALPRTYSSHEVEDREANAAGVWCWPSGYSAKTEFNIDNYGNLMNGREEALVSLSQLRKMNHSYTHDSDYEITGRLVKGGLKTVPYNEVYVRVGGFDHGLKQVDMHRVHTEMIPGSYLDGIGPPIAIFTRTATYGDLIGLLRIRSKIGSILGKMYIHALPLMMINPDIGVRVLTEKLQKELLRTMSTDLNPFQNPLLHYKTSIENSSEKHLQEKRDELFNLDDENIRSVLTAEECARLAGGFGATDDSVAHLLMNAMLQDSHDEKQSPSSIADAFTDSHRLQDIVNEGLCSSVRSGDYNTARQLLILYSLVASKGERDSNQRDISLSESQERELTKPLPTMVNTHAFPSTLSHQMSLPPPPPLDTDRLRFATNSDGLLAVLGAAEILKSMRDGVVKRRAEEVVSALEEWLEKSDSITFRLQSWRNQKAAQGERKIATEQESNLMAFISSKAINNRRIFIEQLRTAVEAESFQSIRFLESLHILVTGLHSPCLRLELLQYILNLDNRFSIAHVARSLELAATCLSVSFIDI